MVRVTYLEGVCQQCKRKMFRRVRVDKKSLELPELCWRCQKEKEWEWKKS